MRSRLGTKSRFAAHLTSLVLLVLILAYMTTPNEPALPMPAVPSAPAAPQPELPVTMPIVVPDAPVQPAVPIAPSEPVVETQPVAPAEPAERVEPSVPEATTPLAEVPAEPAPDATIDTPPAIEEKAPSEPESVTIPVAEPATGETGKKEPEPSEDPVVVPESEVTEEAKEPESTETVEEPEEPETPEDVETPDVPHSESAAVVQPDESGALVVAESDDGSDTMPAASAFAVDTDLEVLGDGVYWLDSRHDIAGKLAAIPETGTLILLAPLPGYRMQGLPHVRTEVISANAEDVTGDAADRFVYLTGHADSPVVVAAVPGASGAAFFKGMYLLKSRAMELDEVLEQIEPELLEAGTAREELIHRLRRAAAGNQETQSPE